MFTVLFVMTYILSVGLGIYWFDYRVDGAINQPLIILATLILAIFITIGMIFFSLETTYYTIAKTRTRTDKFKHKVAKSFTHTLLQLFHVKVKVVGKEHLPKDSRFLIYANHTSELDIPVLMYHLPEYPVAFLSKNELLKWPSIGKWAVSIGCVMLDRENNRKGAESISNVIEHVQTGSTMVVFPEGTVKREIGRLLKFRSGAFRTALTSNVPIVPISIVKSPDYNDRKWTKARHFTLVIHPSIPYQNYQHMKTKELSTTIRTIIKSELNWDGEDE